MSLPHFRHRAVRDLAWACFSEPLMLSPALGGADVPLANTGFALNPQRRDWLAELDRSPAPLLAWLDAAPSRRLGLYFERLWQFFLEQDPAVELVAHNLPVRDGGRTLGEFDCLYYCHRRQRHVHLELAVKFYLAHSAGTQSPSPRDCWLGPDSRDRLDLKLQRLLDHQTRLSLHPQGRAVLAKLGIESPLMEMELKGYLFRPIQQSEQTTGPPAGFNARCRLSGWLRMAELEARMASADSAGGRYQRLPRLHWLAPACVEDPRDALSGEALLTGLREHFAARRGPQLIAGLDHEGRERERFFVTDAGWPQ